MPLFAGYNCHLFQDQVLMLFESLGLMHQVTSREIVDLPNLKMLMFQFAERWPAAINTRGFLVVPPGIDFPWNKQTIQRAGGIGSPQFPSFRRHKRSKRPGRPDQMVWMGPPAFSCLTKVAELTMIYGRNKKMCECRRNQNKPPPLGIVYTTFLWWFGGWFIIVYPH